MGKKATWLAAVLCIAWILPAWALSLGGIRVHSRLNQPLTASIPLSAGPGEVMDESVRVRVAPNEDYARAGLERLEFLSDLDFTVESNRIVVSSRKIAREPVIDLLLEVRWSGGRLLRQYTLLLDPAGIGAAPAPLEPSAPPPQAPSAAPPAASSSGGAGMTRGSGANLAQGNVGGTRARGLRDEYPPSTTPPLAPSRAGPSAPESAPSVSSKPRTYGPVKVNETPWTVATKLRPDDSVTIEQVIIALFQWNPTAFNSALTGFRPGSILRVPDAEVIRRVDPTIAKSRLNDAREKAAEMQAAAPRPEEKPPALQPLPEKPATAEKPAEKPAPAAAAPTPPAPKAETVPPPKAETATSPAPAATPTETAPGATTTPPPAAEAPKPAEEAASTPPAAETEPAKAEEPAAAPRHRKDQGLFDNWMVLVGIALGVLILIVIASRLMRRPKSPGEDFATPDVTAAPAPAAPRPAAMPQARTLEPVFQEPEELPEPARAAPPPPPPPPSPMMAPPAPAAPAAAAPATTSRQPAPFADTALTDTRQIDLEGGDALAEADFHLAYGLYDEAILLLTQAITRDPGRNDVRTKLAEAYFSANRGQEFLETARTLKDKLDPAGWEKIAVLGRQLFPADPLFGGAGKAQPAPSGEVAKAAPPRAAEPAPAPRAAESASIPFDLEPLDLNTPLESATATGGNDFGGDLGIDLESRVNLDDSGLGGDEATTKLDLARAYIDLGDNDMARGLLGEVIQQGSSDQKSTAEDLMRKLPA